MSDITSNDTNHNNNPDYKRNKILTLIGCLLIQVSAGIIPIWGNANIYYLSYFKNHGQNINKATNSYLMIAIVLPMCIMIVFSTKLSNKFGYVNVIKACAWIFFISHLIIYIKFNMILCTIFLLIIPITANSVSFIPMYNCLWSYYLQKKSTITGFAVVCYGISGSILNIMFLHMVNPSNIQAKNNDGNGFVYFDQSVSDNVLYTTKIIFFTISIFFIIGSMLVHKQQQHESNQNVQQQNNEPHFQLKQQPQFQIQQNNQNQNQFNNNNNKEKQSDINQKDIQMVTYNNNNNSKLNSPAQIFSKSNINNDSNNNNLPEGFKLRQHLLNYKFIIVFTNVLFIDFYVVFLLNNFKLIYLQTINDDHFLGYCLITNTITALIGTFLWGYLGDKLKIGRTMWYLIIVDLVIKIFGIFSTTKATLFMLMLLVGFTSRGMSTISGPGLIEIFGLKIATQLLPIKALAVIGSFVLVPIFQIIFLGFMTPFTFMNILIFINVILLFSTYYFINKFKEQTSLENGKKNQQK